MTDCHLYKFMSLLEGLVGQGGEGSDREQLPPHEVPLLVLVARQVGVLHRETILLTGINEKRGVVKCLHFRDLREGQE